EPVDVTPFNQSRQVSACAGGHNRRTGDNCDFAGSATCASQFLGDLANNGRLGFLGVNNVVDELKRIRVRGGSLHRHNADSLVSDNNLVAFLYIKKLYGPRTAFFPVNGDCTIDDSRRSPDTPAFAAHTKFAGG